MRCGGRWVLFVVLVLIIVFVRIIVRYVVLLVWVRLVRCVVLKCVLVLCRKLMLDGGEWLSVVVVCFLIWCFMSLILFVGFLVN